MGGLSFAILAYLCLLPLLDLAASASLNVLEPGQTIAGNQTLVSPGGTFSLGFFHPGSVSSGKRNLYLGIWYSNVPSKTVVWVANREQPVRDSATFLTVAKDGNIALIDPNGSAIWSSDVKSVANGTVVMLLESGNLVLRRGDDQYIWQSFDYPSDTFLPGMKLHYNEKTGVGQRVTAWKDEDDPSPGDLYFRAISFQIITYNRTEIVWRSDVWTGNSNAWAFETNSTGESQNVLQVSRDGDDISVGFTLSGVSAPARCALEPSGVLRMMMWVKEINEWVTFWSRPSRFCDVYGRCGPSGACHNNVETAKCRCLLGFVPKDKFEWEKNNFSGGCVRRSPLVYSRGEKFLLVERTKLPDRSAVIETRSEAECQSECLSGYQCIAYAFFNKSTGRDSSKCLVWHGDLIDLEVLESGGENLNVRLVASELGIEADNDNPSRIIVLPLLLSLGGLLLGGGAYLLVKKLRSHGKEREAKGMNLEDVDFSDAFQREEGLSDAPLVDLKSVRCATSDFSDGNKVGEGGFGSVYKGKLRNGHEVAVKRLSRGSKQGQREFANEVRLIAKLQHKNLVRLLGWCTHKDERILIYEYMPNNSLDKHIFGRSEKLSWAQRLAIIEGIAQGLLYLHHHSRMRVIHRDLKTSNILLDGMMNPKISDFGLARIIEINQTEGSTRKVVGTFGYMSPEYALDGVFSEKSDVFSFGVIVLEIVTGKRSTGYYPNRDSLNLLGHTWRLWNEGRVVELLDPAMGDTVRVEEALKCIQVGLLCIEEDAADRPSMSSVVSMVTSGVCRLALPKQPGFSFTRNESDRQGRSPSCSLNWLTHTTMEAR